MPAAAGGHVAAAGAALAAAPPLRARAPAPALGTAASAVRAWPVRRPGSAAVPASRPPASSQPPLSRSRLPPHGLSAGLAAGAAGVLAAVRRRPRTPRAAAPEKGTRSFVDTPEDFSAIAEYKNLKENPLVSWGFLEEQEFLVRILGLFGVNLVIGLAFCAQVYPPNSFANVVVGGLFGVAIAFSLLFGVLLLITRDWDMVNKMLLKKSYVVEARKDLSMGDGGAYAYNQVKTKKDARRDRLLAGYVTDPVTSRLRVYTFSTLVLSATTWGGGAVVGGEMSMQKEEEEEEDNGIYAKTKSTMNQPGLGYFLERD